MSLSNKKLKYIKRHAATDSPQQIAEALRIPVNQVEAALRDLAAQGSVAPAAVAKASRAMALEDIFAYLLIAIAVISPLIIVKQIAEATKTPQAAFIQVTSVLLLLAWLVTRRRGERLRFGPLPLIGGTLLLLVWSLASFLWMDSARDAHERLLIWGSMPVAFLLTLNLFKRVHLVDAFAIAIFGCGMVTAIIGLMQFWFDIGFFLQTAKPAATFVNKNMAMDFMVLTMPLGIYLLHRFKALRWWALIGFCGAVMMVYTFHGKSKGAWLAVAFQAAIYGGYWLYCLLRWRAAIRRDRAVARPNLDEATTVPVSLPGRRVIRQRVLVMGGCMLLAFSLTFIVRENNKLAFSNQLIAALKSSVATFEKSDVYEQPDLKPVQPSSSNQPETLEAAGSTLESPGDASLAVRKVVWYNTLEMWKAHPIVGVGLGNFRTNYDHFAQSAMIDPFWPRYEWHRVHNDPLQVLAELGIIGAALLLVVLGSLTWIAFRSIRRQYDPLSLALSMGLVGIGVCSFFSFPFDRTIPPLLSAIYAGLLVLQFEVRARSVALSSGLRYGLAGATVVGFLVVVHYQRQIVTADYYARQMYDANASENHVGVVLAVRKLRAAYPARKRPLSFEGRALMSLNRTGDAIRALEELRESYPHWYVGLHNLAVAYQRHRESPKAVETAMTALKLFPQAAETFNAMGCAYLDMKEFEKSEASFREALELNARNHEYWYNLGLALYHQGQVDPALERMERCMSMAPNYALAFKDAGAMYRQRAKTHKDAGRLEASLEDTVRAVEAMAQAIRIDPQVEQAEQMLNFLRGQNYPIDDLIKAREPQAPPLPAQMMPPRSPLNIPR